MTDAEIRAVSEEFSKRSENTNADELSREFCGVFEQRGVTGWRLTQAWCDMLEMTRQRLTKEAA